MFGANNQKAVQSIFFPKCSIHASHGILGTGESVLGGIHSDRKLG
jgi:hypothetical protein